MEFDDILVQLGQFGKYQRIQYFLLCLPGILCAFHQMGSVFLAATPDFRCVLPPTIYNETDTFEIQNDYHLSIILQNINATKTNKTEGDAYTYPQSCQYLDNSTCQGYVYSKADLYRTIITDLDLVCTDEQKVKSTASTAIYMVGVLVGAVVFGIISDRIGRKKTMLICLFIQGTSGLVNGLIPSNYYSYVALQFVIGSASMGLFMTNFVLGMELIGPKYRMVAGIVIEYFFALGYVLIAGIAYATKDWKYLEIALSAPSFLFLSYYWLVPESARWLLANGRKEEAEEIIQKAADTNNVKIPSGVFDSLEENTTTKESLALLAKAPVMIRRTLVIFLNWLVIALSYYALSLNSGSLGGNIFINFMLGGLVEFPAYTACFACNKLGRKPLHIFGMILGGLACLGTVFVDLFAKEKMTDEELVPVFVTLNMVGKFGVSIAFCIIYLWSAELFPTSVRNSMMGFSSATARAGSIAGTFIAQLGKYVPGSLARLLPAGIIGGLVIIGGIASIYLPETSGKSLPETIDEADKFPNHARDKYGQQTSQSDLIDSRETKFDD